jgi:AAA15 family ATPase/GTPase
VLIWFELSNWKSFGGTLRLDMEASREKQHGDRVSSIGSQLRVLPVAAIFGANSSGKSNLVTGLEVLQGLIRDGGNPQSFIPSNAFKLSAKLLGSPTRFRIQFEFLDVRYLYTLSIFKGEVFEEQLATYRGKTMIQMFSRTQAGIEFGPQVKGEERRLLILLAKTTRSNQTFLNTSYVHEIEAFKAPIAWLLGSLRIIRPKSTFMGMEQLLEGGQLYEELNASLSSFETGIAKLDSKLLPLDSSPLPPNLINELLSRLPEGQSLKDEERNLVITKRSGELEVRKVTAIRQSLDGNEHTFDLNDESDGTKRLIDLFPAFIHLIQPGAQLTYVVDELDRSLHSRATESLLLMFLNQVTAATRSQLIFTTHDTSLLTQRLFRRDELWAIQKNPMLESEIFSFADFKALRTDHDLRKLYLSGRLGGVPNVLI